MDKYKKLQDLAAKEYAEHIRCMDLSRTYAQKARTHRLNQLGYKDQIRTLEGELSEPVKIVYDYE
jgi:hypothetical protein